jgi:F-type H+-transporting ATPase subunit b
MQIDWTTFVLEVINFLVLVWLLKHFFYRPVLNVLDARQAKVQAIRSEAQSIRQDAEALRKQYETRLADWNAERDGARRKLGQDLAQERARRLDELRQSLADEEAKNRARSDAQVSAREAALRRQSVQEAYSASAALLQRLASEDLTARIAQLFREDLGALAEPEVTVLRQAAAELGEREPVEVASAHPLAAAERGALAEALARSAGRSLELRFREEPELIAGLRVTVGECQLGASLAEELAFFRHEAEHA